MQANGRARVALRAPARRATSPLAVWSGGLYNCPVDGTRGIPTAVSLFSGCGGSDLALQECGFRILWANDISDAACATYADNVKQPRIHVGDIAGFREFPEADLLVGCYPCQGYSQAGKRDPHHSVNFLYRHFDRALRIVRPRAFVVENVSGMGYGPNRVLLANQLLRYRLAGYRVAWQVLDAKDYGVPQTRRRLFLVGIRADVGLPYAFPPPTHGPGTRYRWSTLRDAIWEMPRWPEGEFCSERFHWYYLSRNRRHGWGEQSLCIVGNWRHVPLHPLSPPLTRVDTDHWIFKTTAGARRLSYKECATLQGFPRHFLWRHGAVRERFRLVGNAVPPPLFAAVLRGLPDIWH